MNRLMRFWLPIPLGCWILTGLAGCKSDEKTARVEKERPVSVFVLQESDPGRMERVAGTVASWKTEEIGFEVSGRVQYVIEPGTNVQGPVYDADDNLISEGTPLARLDDTRYRLNVNSAQAQIETTEQQKKAAQIEVDNVIPAQQRAAEAEALVSKTELGRRVALIERNAIPQEEHDRALADYERAQARVAQQAALKDAKQAEVASLNAQIQQHQASLAEAEKDVEDCVLLYPFRGQVAEVFAIPGAYVQRGQSVLTVQMMDPINIQFEVSAAAARRLNYRDMIPIYVPQPDQSTRRLLASMYMVDPVADPQTRTFTVTLMGRNEQLRTPVPEEMKGRPVVRTNNMWKILAFPPDASDARFMEEHAIHKDSEGDFVWKITNRELGTLASEADPKLNVTKIRVTRGQQRCSLLGIWNFEELTVDQGQEFDPDVDLVTGELTFPPGVDAQSWQGDAVLFDRKRWLLRPGDMVGVDLSGGRNLPGFYVPVDAILEKSDKTYVFAVASAGGGEQARQIEVEVLDSVDTLRRIEAVGDQPLSAGMRIVAAGALLVTDGERINVAEQVEVRR